MPVLDIAFNDEVIKSTQLMRNWGHWATKASSHPVTIMYKDNPITLISRRRISELNKKLYYTSLIFNFCQGIIDGRADKNSPFPWAAYLSDDLKEDFTKELLDAYGESDAKNDWSILQDAIDDWKATAEVESNPKLAKILMMKGNPSQYVKAKG